MLILATLVNPYLPDLPGNPLLAAPSGGVGWRLLYPFELGSENNVAVWWSAALLLICASLSYERFGRPDSRDRLAWLCLSLLMVGFSIDEASSLHERISEGPSPWINLAPFAFVSVVVLSYCLVSLLRRPETRHSGVLIGLGFGMFFLAAFQEFLEHQLTWPDWAIGLRVALEEGTELAGVILILCGIALQRRHGPLYGLGRIVPRPARLPYLNWVLLIGLAYHFFAVYLESHGQSESNTRGRPSSWYPFALWFLLFCSAYWSMGRWSQDKGFRRGVLALLYLFCSVDGIASFGKYVPKLIPVWNDNQILDLYATSRALGVSVQCAIVGGYGVVSGIVGRKPAIILVVGAFLTVFALLVTGEPVAQVVGGTVIGVYAVVSLPDRTSRSPDGLTRDESLYQPVAGSYR